MSKSKAKTKTEFNIPGGVNCATFIGHDQVNHHYGFSAKEVESLIGLVLQALDAGACFVAHKSTKGDHLEAEWDGQKLVFLPGAEQRLGINQQQRQYLLSLVVRRDFQIWATRFVPLEAEVDLKCLAEGLDMPVAYSEFIPPPPGAGLEQQPRTERLADITQALDKHPAFVILGEPGSGKTTTLQKIAFEEARKRLAGAAGRIPLFVRLSQQKGRLPFAFLQEEWALRTGGKLADALAEGRVLILADGINELPREGRSEFLKDWRIFVADFNPANQVVFSSRARDYDPLLNLPRVQVEPLDDGRISDYLQRNQAEGLQELLDDPKTRLRELARNPFYLSLLTFAFKSNLRGMANRGWLLQWFSEQLFSREEQLAHPGWLPRAVQVEGLARLAFSMQEQGESTTLAFKTAQANCPPSIEFNGEDVPFKAADLFRFARAATILDPSIESEVRFYHHLLQEYFAARELLRRFAGGERLAHLWKALRLENEMPPAEVGEWDALPEPPPTGWEVTTILACGLSARPGELIEAVRQVNPVLAGRCLEEAGLTGIEPVRLGGLALGLRAGDALLPAWQAARADLRAQLYDPKTHLRARLQAGLMLGKVGDPRFEARKINGVWVILPEMKDVPAGRYTIGSRDDPEAYSSESPQLHIDLERFRIGRWPVTNAEFTCFIEAGGYQAERHWQTGLARRWLRGEEVAGGQMKSWLDTWQALQDNPDWKKNVEGLWSPEQIKTLEYVAGLTREDLMAQLSRQLQAKSREHPAFWDDSRYNNPSQPVVGLTWFEACAYGAWLGAVTGEACQLPTEFHWEAAARGLKARRYPWGDEWDSARANTLEGRLLRPSAVGAYSAAGGRGPQDEEDQAGNVWEWTSSLYLPYQPEAVPEVDMEAPGERTARGGAWYLNRWDARCAYRGRNVPDDFDVTLGFRLFSPG